MYSAMIEFVRKGVGILHKLFYPCRLYISQSEIFAIKLPFKLLKEQKNVVLQNKHINVENIKQVAKS